MMAGSVTAETAEEVVAWYKGYAKLWSVADVNLDTVEPYYAIPLYYALPNGLAVSATKEAWRSANAAYIATRKQKGITRAELQKVNVTALNPGAAIIEAEWIDYGSDGSRIGDCTAWTYLAAKTTEGWKHLSLIPSACKPASKP